MLELPEFVEQVIVIVVTLALMSLLLVEKIKPAFIFFGAVLVFLLTGIISTDDFLKAVSNESVLSIFLLIFITFGVRTNFNILRWMDRIFGSAKTGRGFILRMTPTVSVFSSFLNNTPIVALFLPYVYQWSRKRKISPSKLLIPLSYAAMAGGMITVIGTSTNLILKGLVEAEGETPPGALDYLFPGLLVTAGTILFLVTLGYAILPNKESLINRAQKKERDYRVKVELAEEADVIGKTLEEAELDKLGEGIELFEIIRYGVRFSAHSFHQKIRPNDSFVFVGNPEKIIGLFEESENFAVPDLKNEKENGKIDSLHKKVSSTSSKSKDKENNEKEEEKDDQQNIVETLIPSNSALIGRTLKGYNFRDRYDAMVIGIHRNGEEISGDIERVRLKPGDLLLLIPGKDFGRFPTQQDDLYVISVKNIKSSSNWKRKGFLVVLALVLLGLGFTDLSLFFALLLLTSYLVATDMMTVNDLKKEFSVNLYVVLAASLAFSTALINSGVAEMAAAGFMKIFEDLGNEGIVIGIYLVTLIIASFVTHAAAVAIVFPMAYAIGSQISGLDMTAVFIAIAFAASASFHTPFSYQTNMMVYGPGGYKFTDFLKVGIPLTILYSVLVIGSILFYYSL